MSNIKKYREEARLSQKELADLCGWGESQSRISNYESGIRQPAIQDMRAIVSALNESGVVCSLDDVFPPCVAA